MIHIDGSQHSGSGTIVRFAAALAALRGVRLHLTNARAKRDKPGLRPQHVAAVKACAALCAAETTGLEVGSRELTFAPRGPLRGGDFTWNIGSAGSATMLALGVLPLACLARAPLVARIEGGVYQDGAPSPHQLDRVLAALLLKMGATVRLRVLRPGYVPTGGGLLELRVDPVRQLRALSLTEAGSVHEVRGIAISSHLEAREVSERMARSCEEQLTRNGLSTAIERVHDRQALQPGAGLAVWAQTSTGGWLGADRAGARRRSAEAMGRFVARALLADFRSGAGVDRHTADQLAIFCALAAGLSRYRTPRISEHLATNLWLIEQFGASVARRGREIAIGGIGVCGAA